MQYQEISEVYEDLEQNPGRLKKTEILAKFLKKLKHEKNKEIIYLLKGQLFPDYDERETGISTQLAIKALSKSTGNPTKDIVKHWKKLGDLGLVSESLTSTKKQSTLFSKKLTINKVLENLQKLPDLVGKGTVDKKLALISELLTSASPIEAKYIIRTLLNDLRIGVGDGTLRDSIVEACLEKNKENTEAVQDAYDKITDFGLVFEKACQGLKSLQRIELHPGKPVKVMLALKAEDIADGFKRVGKPAVFEYKYDGFRMMINKVDNEIKIFTRHLDNVTNRFPEVVEYVKKHIKAKNFIIDAEAVGFNPKTKKYQPFQYISQRIKRKYDIEKMAKQLPVELNAFDIIYYNDKSLLHEPFKKRTEILRKVIKNQKFKLKTSEQLITSDEKEAEKFYKAALDEGQEGVMIKNPDSPYKPGTRVGHMLKLKPSDSELDLVITKAEAGTGKRAGWLTSYTVACRKGDEFLEIGKVSTGLKEKPEQGLSFLELTKKLKPLITKEKGRMVWVKPEIVVMVTYQNIQKSPTYESKFALRFPRITRLRPDRSPSSIATLKEIEQDFFKKHDEYKY